MKPAPALCVDPDCPAPSHDTSGAFRHGCRSAAARAAHCRENKQRRLGIYQPKIVDGTGTVRRLQALAAIGWSSQALGDELGVGWRHINQLRAARHRPTVRTVKAVTDLYERLSMTPGGSARAAADARRKGWAPPLAWPDDAIDDPTATPDATGPADEDGDANVVEAVLRGRVLWRDLTGPDRALLVAELQRRGYSCNSVALAAGANFGAVRSFWKTASAGRDAA